MKNIFIFLFVALVSVGAYATTPSTGDYTYQRDKQFNNLNQLTGQTFVPKEYVEGRGGKKRVAPGSVMVHFGADMVGFKGVDGLKTFGVIAKTKIRKGFEYKLVDRRGSDFSKIQVLTDKYNYIHTINFYSKKYGAFTFYLPQKTKDQLKKERAYFTAKKKHTVKAYTDLVNKTIVPYQEVTDASAKNALKAKVPMNRKFNMTFTEEEVKIKVDKEEVAYKIRKVKTKRTVTGKAVNTVMEIKVKKRPKKVILNINDKNQIDNITIKNSQYFLM